MENRQRLDLTEWVIHFVHDRKPDDNLDGLYENYLLFSDDKDGNRIDSSKLYLDEDDFRYPDFYDSEGKGHNMLDEFIENEYPIDENASAFSVLKKILHDGFIHSSWSIRNGIPSVYGPNSAVCFTEMPLYALVDYARVRGEKSGYVGNYGIAFRRNELFAAGARPVIYGLSGEFKETDNLNGVYQGRLLDSSCGIGVHEQYRYVSTLLPKKYGLTIDWTHEREWRWALPNDSFGVPGLPFFLSKDFADFFTDVIIIVGTDEEQEDILLHLKNLYDSGCRNTGFDYNKEIISSAKVLSLEAIANEENIDFQEQKDNKTKVKQLMSDNFLKWAEKEKPDAIDIIDSDSMLSEMYKENSKKLHYVDKFDNYMYSDIECWIWESILDYFKDHRSPKYKEFDEYFNYEITDEDDPFTDMIRQEEIDLANKKVEDIFGSDSKFKQYRDNCFADKAGSKACKH